MTCVKNSLSNQPLQRRWLVLSTAVLVLGSVFRLVALQDVPPGLAQDEVLNADIVSFIRGGEHAFFFRYGYGHEALYHYWSVPFQVLLGDNYLSIRLPAVFLGMLLIALTLRWARRDFGSIAALVTGFGLAVSWWPVVFSRIGLRPIMEPVLLVVAAILWPMACTIVSRKTIVAAAMTGVALGLSLYTYTAARVIVALPAFYALYAGVMSWVRKRDGEEQHHDLNLLTGTPVSLRAYRSQALLALVTLLVMLVMSLPLFLTLRADPSLQQRVDQLSGPLDALQQGDWQPVLSTTLATLGVVGVTGDPRWTYGLPHQPLFEPLAAILFLVGLSIALLRWKRPPYAFVLIWLAVALVPSAVTPDAPSSVRLVGAMPIVYLLPGVAAAAVLAWFREHRRGSAAVTSGLAAVLVLLAALTIGRTVRDGFVRWPAELETRLKYQTVLLDISRDTRLTADSGQLSGPPLIVDGFYEPLDDATLRRNLNRDPAARWVQTGAGLNGAIVWPVQDTVANGGPSYLYVPEFAAPEAQLLKRANISEVPELRSEDRPSYAVYALPTPPTTAADRETFSLDGEALLNLNRVVGPGEKGDVAPGNGLVLYSDWLVEAPLPSDLAIFVHLVDESGKVVAQFDGFDAAAERLQPGDRVLQRHVLDVPSDLSAGTFALRLGLYRRSDGSRLLTSGLRDAIDISTCQVAVGEGTQNKLQCDLPEDR